MTKGLYISAEDVLRGETAIMLATSDGDQPRVRPVTLVENRGELFVLTGTKDAKVTQIQANGKVECLALVKHKDATGYVRFSANATIENDSAVRARIAKATSFFDQFWDSPEHPGFALIRIRPVRVEFMKPGEMEPTEIDKLEL